MAVLMTVNTRKLAMKKARRLLIPYLILTILFLTAATVIIADGLRDELHPVDVGIVLGNQVCRDGSLSDRLKARLDRWLGLYRGGYLKTLIVSGGTGKNGVDEALVMQRYLVGQGIPKDRVYVDSGGSNTYLIARNSSRIMRRHGMRSAMVITQYFHVSRSRLALRRFGVSPVYGAHARFFEWRDFYSTGREVAGYIAYSLRSYQPR